MSALDAEHIGSIRALHYAMCVTKNDKQTHTAASSLADAQRMTDEFNAKPRKGDARAIAATWAGTADEHAASMEQQNRAVAA